MLLIIAEQFDEHNPVGLPLDYVYPPNYCESHIVDSLLIVDDVAFACREARFF